MSVMRPQNFEVFGSVNCNNGRSCRFLRHGFCRFYHPPSHQNLSTGENGFVGQDSNNVQSSLQNNPSSSVNNWFNDAQQRAFMFSSDQTSSSRQNGVYQQVSQQRNNDRYRRNNRARRRRQNFNRSNGFPTTVSTTIPNMQTPCHKEVSDNKRSRSNHSEQHHLKTTDEINIDALNCPISMEVIFYLIINGHGITQHPLRTMATFRCNIF